VIDVSAHEPRRIPSKKWRELIKKVCEVDPLRCPNCSREMCIVSLIGEEDVIEQAHPAPSRALARGGARAFWHRPAGRNDPQSVARRPLRRLRHRTGHGVLSHPETSDSARVRLSHPCSAALSPPAAAFSVRARPATRKSPCLTSGPTFVTLRPCKRTLSASDSGPTPRRATSDFLSVQFMFELAAIAAAVMILGY
jgi:hypothetical protein